MQGIDRPHRVVAWTIGIVLLAASGARASFISSDERIETSAKVEIQNTFHHRSASKIDWVQFRNEFRLDFRYYFLGEFAGPTGAKTGFKIYPLNRARFSLLWRARYDAVFDIRDHYRDLGYDRDDFRFPEGKVPRELFIDLEFQNPIDWLSFRIGRQQIVWGEADLFRSLDVINPLRLDQNGLIGEDFDEYREPLWIAKGLISAGDLFGEIVHANSLIEFFVSANSRPLTDRVIVQDGFRLGIDQNFTPTGNPHPNLRRPTRLPFSQVRHPWEVTRTGQSRTDAPDHADIGTGDPNSCLDGGQLGPPFTCGDFIYLIQNGFPGSVFSEYGFMGGIRWFSNIKGIEYSLNYIYKRAEIPALNLRVSDLFDPTIATDGSPNPRLSLLAEGALAEASLDGNGNGVPDGREQLIQDCIYGNQPKIILAALRGPNYEGVRGNFSGCELVGVWYPRTHIIGFTGTYVDFDYTGAVLRIEQSFSTKEPRTAQPPLAGIRAGEFPTARDFDTHIKRQTQVWRSMVGFDYLQTLWPQPPGWLRHSPVGTLVYDQWFFTVQFFNEYYSNVNGQIGNLVSVTDRHQHFNPIFTYVMTGFFAKDKLRPFIAVAYDVNADFWVSWVQAEWYFTDRLAMRIAEITYWGDKNSESFLFLNKYSDRDTLFLRFTYYLI